MRRGETEGIGMREDGGIGSEVGSETTGVRSREKL